MNSLNSLPKCDKKMPTNLVKHIIQDIEVNEELETFIKNLLQNNCHALVIDDKDVVFNYYQSDHSFRKKMLDKIIQRELCLDESIELLFSHKSIDIYMKYDDEDSWKVRISIEDSEYDLSYFICNE